MQGLRQVSLLPPLLVGAISLLIIAVSISIIINKYIFCAWRLMYQHLIIIFKISVKYHSMLLPAVVVVAVAV